MPVPPDKPPVRVRVQPRQAPWHEGDVLVIPLYEERVITTTVLVVDRHGTDGHWQPEEPALDPTPTRRHPVRQTVVALFDHHAAAELARDRLAARGIASSDITVTEAHGGGAGTTGPESEGVIASVKHFFSGLFSRDDSDEIGTYSDAVRRGGAVVRVEVDDDRLDVVRDELAEAGAADIDERLESWKTEHRPGVAPAAGSTAGESQGVIPVGQKTDRVVDDVVVGKEVRQTQASVEDTARHTEVEVQTLDDASDTGELSDAERADVFGRALRAEDRYRGLSWDEVEPHARASWTARYPDSPWERFKDSARRSWDRLTE